MTATQLGTWPAGSPEWHAARAGLVMTGSRIAAAAGISPFESPFSLYHRMTGAIGEPEETPVMEWGNRLESAVVQKFADEHPELHVTRTGTWRNDERPWQQGTPDGLLWTPDPEWTEPSHPDIIDAPRLDLRALLEVKTARYDDDWGTSGTDQIPVHYLAQVLWYLDTLGLDLAYVAVLVGGSDYREYLIEYDESEALRLREIGLDFLAMVKEGIRPDIDGHSQTYQTIKELHPDIEPTTVEVSDATAFALFDAKYDYDAAAIAFAAARARLADDVGSAHYAYWRGIKVADRRVKKADGSTPYMQLANKLPIITGEKTA